MPNRPTRKSFPVLLILFWLAGCDGKCSLPRPAKRPAKRNRATGSTVARIVFISKKNACQCTRRRIEKTWADLQSALKGKKIPVQKIFWDTQEAEAQKYRKMERFMTLPAVYFLDKEGRIVEMLQGEVDRALIVAALSQNRSETKAPKQDENVVRHDRRDARR